MEHMFHKPAPEEAYTRERRWTRAQDRSGIRGAASAGCGEGGAMVLTEDQGGTRDAPREASVVEALACGQAGCVCRLAAAKGMGLTHCPAHDDRHPSLGVSVGGERPLFRCHAGCSQDAVLGALRERGLWPERPTRTLAEQEAMLYSVAQWEIRDVDDKVIAIHE